MRKNGTPFFQEFSEDVSSIKMPTAFTYPFFYEPHQLTLKAAAEVQNYLSKESISHNFGLGGAHAHLLEQGKMFGVMVVLNNAGNMGDAVHVIKDLLIFVQETSMRKIVVFQSRKRTCIFSGTRSISTIAVD